MTMRIETIARSKLIPSARNARTHSEAQVAEIAGSIREFGWTNPVLIDEADGIIAGHGRVLAAALLDIKRIPCIRLAHLNDAQKRAYMLADNKIALNAGWDEAMLRIELSALKVDAFDLDLIGFNDGELRVLTNDLQTTSGAGAAAPTPRYLLMIECDDEKQLSKLFDEMQKRNLNVKVLD